MITRRTLLVYKARWLLPNGGLFKKGCEFALSTKKLTLALGDLS